jgi:hypothetical protein
MKPQYLMLATALAIATLAAGCAKKQEGPIDKAVENTKDALNVRDHEKLKDASESAQDAMKSAGDGIKDAANETAADAKAAARDANRR